MKYKIFSNLLSRNNIIYKFLKRRGVITLLTFGITAFYYDQIAMSLIGESYSRKQCDKALKERFEYAKKYKKNNNEEESDFCTIFPSNIYDAQRLLEIANYYNIPLIFDINSSQNILKFSHFNVDFSKYTKITDFNEKNKTITVEPGVKIKEIFQFLEKYELTIPKLENYKFTDLSINDIYFNNFFGSNEGSFIDDLVEEITVAIPRNERILKLKQNDDLTMTGLNLKNLFLRTNSTMGLILESKLKVKRNKNMKYLCIQSLENKLEETLGIVEEINENKKDLGLKDINIIYRDKEIDICLKIKDKHLKKSLELLKSTQTVFDQIDKDEYYKSMVFSNNTHDTTRENYNAHVLRKLKINLNKSSLTDFLKKAEKLAIENNIDMEFRCSFSNHELEMIIKIKDDLVSIDNSYKFLNKIHSFVLKSSGNIFSNLLLILV